MFLRHWHTEFLSLTWSTMLEPVANINTLLIAGSYKLLSKGYRSAKLV